MLSQSIRRHERPNIPRARQQGVTLMIALVVLVAMTLAGIALVRSVDSTNIIAGNLAFQQAATHSGDIGIENAIGWLEKNNAAGYLNSNHNSLGDCNGYTASRVDPGAGISWASWWSTLSACQKVSLATDASGNTVSYSINRLCQTTGPSSSPAPQYCSVSPVSVTGSSNSQTSGTIALQYSGQVYYRITSRIDGPRSTVSYVQAIVAM